MSLVVLKPFVTTLRRFALGAPIEADADLSPFTIGDLKDRGFVGDNSITAAKPAAK